MLAADGFEQVEVTRPLKELLRQGAVVDIVSLHRGTVRGLNLIGRGHQAPGEPHGRPGSARRTTTRSTSRAASSTRTSSARASRRRSFALAFDVAGKPISTLCHGPWVLVSAGLVRGRRLAAWPGIQDDIRNAGGTWVDEPLVQRRQLGVQPLAPGPPAVRAGDGRALREGASSFRAGRPPETLQPLSADVLRSASCSAWACMLSSGARFTPRRDVHHRLHGSDGRGARTGPGYTSSRHDGYDDLPRQRPLERHRSALTGHCYRMLGSPEEADDAVQETFVRAWRSLDRFEQRSSLQHLAVQHRHPGLPGHDRRPRAAGAADGAWTGRNRA